MLQIHYDYTMTFLHIKIKFLKSSFKIKKYRWAKVDGITISFLKITSINIL